MILQGRNVIITGASQGLGAAIAEYFASQGASLLLCARSPDKLVEVASGVKKFLAPSQKIVVSRCDVSQPREVDAMIADAVNAFGRIDVLVNNAGVYGPMGEIENIDWQEWVDAIQINLMGTVYPCRAVMGHFRKNGYGKIVNLSGGGATTPLPRISAYAASKAAVVRFTESLALEAGAGIDVNAVAPGALATQMMDAAIAAGPEKVGRQFYDRMVQLKAEGGTPLRKGAELCAFLASSQSDGITGKLISAVWDPWRAFESHIQEITETDIYTLRRIVPGDRGKDWG